MHPTHIIKRPLITEKASVEADEANRYSFEVAMTADKEQIKRAIAAIYNVTVTQVRTQVRKGGQKRTKYGYISQKPWKRATVQLDPDDTIELF